VQEIAELVMHPPGDPVVADGRHRYGWQEKEKAWDSGARHAVLRAGRSASDRRRSMTRPARQRARRSRPADPWQPGRARQRVQLAGRWIRYPVPTRREKRAAAGLARLTVPSTRCGHGRSNPKCGPGAHRRCRAVPGAVAVAVICLSLPIAPQRSKPVGNVATADTERQARPPESFGIHSSTWLPAVENQLREAANAVGQLQPW
jgi:hypothetical protein